MNNMDLRKTLADTMQDLKNGKINVATAKGIAELGQTMLNSAKLDIEMAKITKREQVSQFFNEQLVENTPPKQDMQTGALPRIVNNQPTEQEKWAAQRVIERSGGVTRVRIK